MLDFVYFFNPKQLSKSLEPGVIISDIPEGVHNLPIVAQRMLEKISVLFNYP